MKTVKLTDVTRISVDWYQLKRKFNLSWEVIFSESSSYGECLGRWEKIGDDITVYYENWIFNICINPLAREYADQGVCVCQEFKIN